MRKVKKLYAAIALALAAMLVASTAAMAAVSFDPVTGTGFVGKGDVQLIYGWNNQQLQTNAGSVKFRATTTSTANWTCSRPAPTPRDPDREITQERASTTTTQGVVTKIARERNQITGFILNGYSGTPVETTDGPAVGTCPSDPTGASQFTFDEGSLVQSDPVTVLEVSNDGINWTPLS